MTTRVLLQLCIFAWWAVMAAIGWMWLKDYYPIFFVDGPGMRMLSTTKHASEGLPQESQTVETTYYTFTVVEQQPLGNRSPYIKADMKVTPVVLTFVLFTSLVGIGMWRLDRLVKRAALAEELYASNQLMKEKSGHAG